jgi:C4-dicarboxylate-specific signal transduction histidine kinase
VIQTIYDIVKAYSGALSAEGNDGSGAEFVIALHHQMP